MPDSKSRVVILIQQPLAPRDFSRFGIGPLLARGYDVSVLDVADLAFPMLPNIRVHYSGFSGFDLSIIRNRSELRAAGRTIAEAQLALCFVGSGHIPARAWPVLQLLSATLTPYLMIADSTPTVSDPEPRKSRTLDRIFKRGNPLNILDSILARLPLRLLGVRPPDYIVLPALKADLKRPLLAAPSQKIPAHVLDYDLYLDEMTRPEELQNIAVYLDQNIGFHPDLKSMGVRWFAPDQFYADLRRFFDKVEAEQGLEVVIAAHPRADYSRTPNLFGSRRILQDGTTSLIRNSELVIACYSAALLQAVMFRKPLLLHTSHELMAYPLFAGHIRNYAKLFETSPVMIDDHDAADIASFICDTRRIHDEILQNWVRHPDAPEKPYWDIVIDALVGHDVLPRGCKPVLPRRSLSPRSFSI